MTSFAFNAYAGNNNVGSALQCLLPHAERSSLPTSFKERG